MVAVATSSRGSAAISTDAAAIIRSRVAGTWAFRTRAEIEATARFRRMATELVAVGATEVVVRGVQEAAED